MKRIFFLAITGMICLLTSCSDHATSTDTKAGNTAEEQKNLAAFDVVTKAFQTGDVSGLDSVIADDYLDHSDRGDVKGRDSLKAMVKFVKANFKDMKTEQARPDVADGDYVYGWMIYSGTSDGLMGMPKGPYKMQSMEVAKFKDGKAVEHWAFMDAQDVMKMMPPPSSPAPQENKMDTSKMHK